MNEEQINAARAAYQRDPETACQALLGCSAEEMFITALRGCNQHKHKPGCPDANGGGEKKPSAWAERWRAKSDEEKLAAYEYQLKKYEEKVQKEGAYDAWEKVKYYRSIISRMKKKLGSKK